MGRKAKPLQQQIALLRKRGMIIDDEQKARDNLLEIGWYRLSLYWFPFERRYPDRMSEEHRFYDGVHFNDALLLYAFDFNMRNLLLRVLERLETAFRTYLIYQVSNLHPESPFWFADEHVVSKQHARNFEKAIYLPLRKNNDDIALHHRRFPKDRFAPAWKTLEFVTFGAICQLYSSLNSQHLQRDIARHFGVEDSKVMENYLEAMRALRNNCAHGNILYAFRSPSDIAHGPASHGGGRNLGAALEVLHYFCRHISPRVAGELKQETSRLVDEFGRSQHLRHVLHKIAGL